MGKFSFLIGFLNADKKPFPKGRRSRDNTAFWGGQSLDVRAGSGKKPQKIKNQEGEGAYGRDARKQAVLDTIKFYSFSCGEEKELTILDHEQSYGYRHQRTVLDKQPSGSFSTGLVYGADLGLE